MKNNKTLFDIMLTALAPIFWGTTYIVTTEFLPADKPLIAAMLRTLPAGLLLTLISRQLPNANHGHAIWWKVLCLSFLNITCFQILLFVAAYRLPGGIAAIAGSVQPLVIMLLLFFADKVRPTATTIIATLTSILGLSLLLLKPDAQWDVIGLLAAFTGAVSMALGVYLTKRWRPSVDILTFTGWQLCFGGAMLVPIALSLESLPPAITAMNMVGYAYLTVCGSLIAYTLWFRGISKLPAVAVSILGALSPITATLIGWVWLNQSLSMLQVIGLVVVLISIMVIQQQPAKKTKRS